MLTPTQRHNRREAFTTACREPYRDAHAEVALSELSRRSVYKADLPRIVVSYDSIRAAFNDFFAAEDAVVVGAEPSKKEKTDDDN